MSLRSPSRAFVVIALVAAAALPASAEELQLDSFQYLRRRVQVAPKGKPLSLMMRGLPADPAAGAVTVQVGSKDARVDVVAADSVTITVPDASVGRTTVRVTVQGRTVEAPIQVVEANHPDIIAIENQAERGGGGPALGEGDLVRGLIRITRFVLVQDAAGERFDIEVSVGPLPDGAKLDVSLALAEPRVPLPLNVRLVSAGGKAAGSLALAPKRAFPGDYEVRVLFDGTKQTPAVSRWIKAQTSDAAREAWLRIEKPETLRVGSDEEVAAQQVAVRDHHRAVADEARRLLTEVDRAYASAARSLFRDAGGAGFNEGNWRAHVSPLAPTPAEQQVFDKDMRFATPRGHLKPQELEAWVEATLRPGLLALDERRRVFAEAWLAPPAPKADELSSSLVAFVGTRFTTLARTLHEFAKLPLPPTLADLPGANAPAPEGRNGFFAKRRLLLRTIGLADVADAEEAAR